MNDELKAGARPRQLRRWADKEVAQRMAVEVNRLEEQLNKLTAYSSST